MTNDNRVLDSVWENGRLWLSANGRCVPPGDAILRSCARVVELETATGSVAWDTDLWYAGASVFYPALRPDLNGNLVIAMRGVRARRCCPSSSSSAARPTASSRSRSSSRRAPGSTVGDRYGDYFGAARDPAHPALVWVGGEAGTDLAGGRGWATAVASVA